MAVINKDISRSRKAYSYFRPRPIYRTVATEEDMSNINATINSIQSLQNSVNSLNSQLNSGDNIVWNEIPSGAINGSNVTFVLAYTPIVSKTMVFVNGVLQERDSGGADYYLNGKTITFNNAPIFADKVIVTYAKSV